MEPNWLDLRSGGEFDLIRVFARAAGEDGSGPVPAVPPGDDAVGLEVPAGETLLVSSDASVEAVHFKREWSGWETVGWRAVVAALSDLAAMAAQPGGVLVTLMLPPELDRGVVEGLGAGAGAALREAEARLLGGDVVRTPGGVALDVTAVGWARSPVRRDGLSPGDELWVTGELGGAAAAVRDWSRGLEPDPRSRRAYARPSLRLAEARWLAERADLRALIDVSDGLAADGAQLAAASGCRVELDASAVPLAPALEEMEDRERAIQEALSGGEDYELLLAVETDALGGDLRRDFLRAFGISLTRVGRAVSGSGVAVDGRILASGAAGHDHFAEDDD